MSENKTASERLETLEGMMPSVIQGLQAIDPIARDLSNLKEAANLLNNKLNALIQVLATKGTTVTDQELSDQMAANKSKELADKVADLVKNNVLAATDTVSADSFVVLSESDASGNTLTLRSQFLVSALNSEDIKAKLIGTKVGDQVTANDQGNSLKILEIYEVVKPASEADASTPTADASATDAAASTDAPATDASAPAASADAAQTAAS